MSLKFTFRENQHSERELNKFMNNNIASTNLTLITIFYTQNSLIKNYN